MRYVVMFVVEAQSVDEGRGHARVFLGESDCIVNPELAGATHRLKAARLPASSRQGPTSMPLLPVPLVGELAAAAAEATVESAAESATLPARGAR